MVRTPAVMLAGDRKASKLIEHENKAFLEFRGEPLFIHVLRALIEAESVEQIVIVGPKSRLEDSLNNAGFSGIEYRDIVVVEQKDNLLANAKAGFLASLPEEYREVNFEELKGTSAAENFVLFLSCDIPLVTSYEIDEFVRASDMDSYDYSIGLTPESALTFYYPTETQPGIRMDYYHLRDGRVRHNNLHLGRPLKATKLHYIERMYELRYQNKWYNMIRSTFMLLSTGIMLFPTLYQYFWLQRARRLYQQGRMGRYERTVKKVGLGAMIHNIELVLGFRMQASFSHYGGATLDVDNADHLEITEKMADLWIEHQNQIYRTASESGSE